MSLIDRIRGELASEAFPNLQVSPGQRKLSQIAALALPATSTTGFSLADGLPGLSLRLNDALWIDVAQMRVQPTGTIGLLSASLSLNFNDSAGNTYNYSLAQLLATGLNIAATQNVHVGLSPMKQLITARDLAEMSFSAVGATPTFGFPFINLSLSLNGALVNNTAGALAAQILFQRSVRLVNGIAGD